MIHLDWGAGGMAQLAPVCDVLVIVDVLSFSTSVDVAAARGALIYPFGDLDESAEAYASRVGGTAAGPRAAGSWSLSPDSLREIPPGTRLILSSLNGAVLSLAAGETPVFAGCLRNAAAVAQAAGRLGGQVGILAAGERRADGSLRFALEDWLGAGAIAASLGEEALSPEARAARASFLDARDDLLERLLDCPSGVELVQRGFRADVRLAAELNVSRCAPRLLDGAYQWTEAAAP